MNDGIGDLERRSDALDDALTTDIADEVDIAEFVDRTDPLACARPASPGFKNPFALVELTFRDAGARELVDIDGLAFDPSPTPSNDGFFASGMGGFATGAGAGFDAFFFCSGSVVAAFVCAGFETGMEEDAVEGPPAPRFHTRFTSDFAEDRNPNRDVAPFCFSVMFLFISIRLLYENPDTYALLKSLEEQCLVFPCYCASSLC